MKSTPTSIQRRDFLIGSGALVVAATGALPLVADAQTAAAAQATSAFGIPAISKTKPKLAADELDSWVAIHPDGKVTAYYGKVDLGQGLEVAIGQIVAEELDVAFSQVRIVMGDTRVSMNQGGASSALGIQAGAKPLRNAAAEARRILLDLAAAKLGVPLTQLAAFNGVVREVTAAASTTAKQVTYAELVGGQFFNSKVEWNQKIGNPLEIKVVAKTKNPAQYKVVGQPIPRGDIAGKVFGTQSFITDIRVPNMLHARIIRTPTAGSVAQQVDAASIAHIAGARVVHDKNFLAVVAPKEWDAVRAARDLKVVWTSQPKALPTHSTVHAHIKAAAHVKRDDSEKNGDVDAAFAAFAASAANTVATKIIEAEYLWPFQSHASMGPACAIADVRADSATLWTGTQKPHYARDGVAALLKIPVDKVHGIWVIGPGSYGRNDAGDAALDAAKISQLVGAPVRVQYMRHEGTGWDPKAPASVHRGRAALDAQGKVVAYEFISKGYSRADIDSNESDLRDSLVGQATGTPPRVGIGFGTPSESYGFDNKRLGWEVIPAALAHSSPLRTSHLRDPVGLQIHFASEQFIDELAFATHEDPLAFRLRYAKAPRDQALLKALGERAKYVPRKLRANMATGQAGQGLQGNDARPGAVLKGRGMAYAQRAGTIVGVMADIEVDTVTGRIWGRKFTVAHDCGLVINPEGLRYTIEGGLVQALSRCLFEEVQFDSQNVTSTDWNTYPILGMQDAPESIDVLLINRPEAAPTGAGEATCRVLPAAVANAFFDATGVRLRQAPMTPERVLAALSKRG